MQSLRRQLKRGNAIIFSDSINELILTKPKNGASRKHDTYKFRLNHPKRNREKEQEIKANITMPIKQSDMQWAKENNQRYVYIQPERKRRRAA